MPPVAAATAGAVCISSSAVLMKLASTASPSVVALGRCAFALPVLGVLALREHRRGS
jgi:coenzyme F420-reducing hydrogenase gamma subunit